MTSSVTDPLHTAATWLEAGHNVALATVIATWGSSPRPSGSQLVVNEAGEFVGSVSGGCVEGAVVTEALDVIHSRQTKLLEFGVPNEDAWELGLACGGQVTIFVEPVTDSANHG